MSPWSLELGISRETADSPSPQKLNSRHVSVTVDYRMTLALPASETPPREMCYEANTGLMPLVDFLGNADSCFSVTAATFRIELLPDAIDRFVQVSRAFIEANPNRRVVPLRLIIKGETVLPSVDAIEQYMVEFGEALSAETLTEVTAREEEQCSICLEDFGEDGEGTIVGMPCKHVYHKHCIVPWLKKRHSCPLCRSQMTKR